MLYTFPATKHHLRCNFTNFVSGHRYYRPWRVHSPAQRSLKKCLRQDAKECPTFQQAAEIGRRSCRNGKCEFVDGDTVSHGIVFDALVWSFSCKQFPCNDSIATTHTVFSMYSTLYAVQSNLSNLLS